MHLASASASLIRFASSFVFQLKLRQRRRHAGHGRRRAAEFAGEAGRPRRDRDQAALCGRSADRRRNGPCAVDAHGAYSGGRQEDFAARRQ